MMHSFKDVGCIESERVDRPKVISQKASKRGQLLACEQNVDSGPRLHARLDSPQLFQSYDVYMPSYLNSVFLILIRRLPT